MTSLWIVLARLLALTVLFQICLLSLVSAHELDFTETTVLLRPDGTFEVNLICDLDALALGGGLGRKQLRRRLAGPLPPSVDAFLSARYSRLMIVRRSLASL